MTQDEEELETRLKQCDPSVQEYVAELKAETQKLQGEIAELIAKREQVKVIAVFVFVAIILILVVIICIHGGYWLVGEHEPPLFSGILPIDAVERTGYPLLGSPVAHFLR